MANSTAAVSEFKAHLSEYLRHVQNGDEITILDHKRPIAKVVPITEKTSRPKLEVIPAQKKKFRDIRPKGVKLDFDPAQYVIEDREDRIY
jgi:prevent-host-death family protein